jgi:hypothetical protein
MGITQPSIHYASNAISPGVKQPVREGDHKPPPSAEVKNAWSYSSSSSSSLLILMAWSLIKHTDSSNFHFTTIQEFIQKFQDWQPGARTANGTALCH